MTYLTAAAADTSSIWLIVGLVVVLALMMGFSVFSNKKKRKKADEMLSSIKKGVQIKTIGGFVATVTAIDDQTGTMVINLGSDENPINVTIDKAAVYTVLTKEEPIKVETSDGTVVELEDEGAKSLDDIEADAKAKAKAEKRKKSKKAQDAIAIEEPAAQADEPSINIESEAEPTDIETK